MPHTDRYDQTVAEELNKIGADVEDDIDRLEVLLVELDNLRARIVALL